MKFIPSRTAAPSAAGGSGDRHGASAPATAKLDRRGLVVGAGVAGVAAVAAQVLHRAAVDAPVAVAAKAPVADGAGYQVTPHVLRYYETAKS